MILRVMGYIAGLAGLILFTTGRQDASSMRALVGSSLLIAGFAAFLGSYVLYIMMRLRRGSGVVYDVEKKNGP